MTRTRSFIRWVRIIHRWVSMAFAILAAILILPVLPAGAVFTTVSAVAILLLILLLLSGIWMAVHHYVVKFRRPTVRRSAPQAEQVG